MRSGVFFFLGGSKVVDQEAEAEAMALTKRATELRASPAQVSLGQPMGAREETSWDWPAGVLGGAWMEP